jgi:cobyrinic acid a,c-diamide synthase
VIAGNKSGVGKTTLTLALVAALVRRGLKVQTYKVGPDFLDPTYLAIASGRPCYNLDGWMSGRDYVKTLFARTAGDADVAVIEGVMGLFDGADHASVEGSTAEIAQWLNAPVLLIVNAHGMSRSLAALVKGYAGFEKDIRIAGVIANQCGSAKHGTLLESALEASACPPLVGAVPRGAVPELKSRHLGLVTADTMSLSPEVLDSLASVFERHAHVGRILQMAGQSPSLTAALPEAETKPARIRLGIARDRAFHFYYQDLFDELIHRGCSLEFFSPLDDTRLPEGLHGLYLGGGYPEAWAGELSANEHMINYVQAFAQTGRPVYAECGGLIYLSQGIETLDGKTHKMSGILPAAARMLERRQALGYVEATLEHDSLWGMKGMRVRGHEFHYSALTSNPAGKDGWRTVYTLRKTRTKEPSQEGFQHGSVLASYVHLHLACRPQSLDRFVALCKND